MKLFLHTKRGLLQFLMCVLKCKSYETVPTHRERSPIISDVYVEIQIKVTVVK